MDIDEEIYIVGMVVILCIIHEFGVQNLLEILIDMHIHILIQDIVDEHIDIRYEHLQLLICV